MWNWSGKGNMAGTWKDVELKGSEEGHKDTYARDTGLKCPIAQRGDVDIEEEEKTKTSSVRNDMPAEDRGSHKKIQDKK